MYGSTWKPLNRRKKKLQNPPKDHQAHLLGADDWLILKGNNMREFAPWMMG
jgi:hypothetical protein